MTPNDRLLIAAKAIVNDMDELARIGHKDEIPVYFGMGQSLNRIYSVLRSIPVKDIHKIVPLDMMAWVRDQPLPEAQGNETLEDVLRKMNR